ncbi:MAG: efflux RND transporter periplasmic adaptor subunit [Sedimentisphaerales bacterium]
MKHILSKKLIGVIAIVVVIAFVSYSYKSNNKTISYRTVPITRGDLIATIQSTGTVEPEELVDIGAQVAGIINSFGKDKDGNTVDYGSVVEEGTILAVIDDSLYATDRALAAAQLEQAKAKLYQAERDWARAQKLGPSEALAESSYDAYKSAYDIAKANVAIAEATLSRAKRNLDYCVIKSPVKGVIIDRRVNIGQTVVSSLNAPSLFLLAKDLKRMQVWTSVNEADIGNIHPDQPVTFTVDAYPGQTFKGAVGKIRLNAMMTQNVVTYTVEVVTDNSDGKLLPYLTANAKFETSHRSNVLQIPNAALRWSPKPAQIAPEFLQKASHKDANQNRESQNSNNHNQHGILWIQEGNYVKPIKVRTGLNDGTMTEIEGSEIKEGLEIITGEQQQTTANTGTTNPFVPQIRRTRSQ